MGSSPGKEAPRLSPNGEIQVLRDGEVTRTVPAEYVRLDYPEIPWRGDPGMGASLDSSIYVALYHRIFYSNAGGRSWDVHSIPIEILEPTRGPVAVSVSGYDSFLVLRDGTPGRISGSEAQTDRRG